MQNKIFSNKKVVYGLMTLLVFFWGFEYVAAKAALSTFEPMTLIFVKYGIAALVLFIVRTIQRRKFPLKKKHIITLIICSLLGEVLYFWAEYSAMAYLPVSTISIILAFVPMLSIVLEIFIDKKLPNTLIVTGIAVCIVGVALFIGVDIGEILSGRWIGYLFAFGAVLFWNGFNFVTERLTGEYTSYDLAFMQLVCTILLTLPFAIASFPDAELLTIQVVGGTLYLGVVSACLGFLIYVLGISVLGPTPCALFSNFLPITTAIFGWIFLGESLTWIQMIGGLIVIGSGALVIWQKGKLDERYIVLKENN